MCSRCTELQAEVVDLEQCVVEQIENANDLTDFIKRDPNAYAQLVAEQLGGAGKRFSFYVPFETDLDEQPVQ